MMRNWDCLVDAGNGLTLGPGQLGLVLDASYFGNSTTYAHVPTDAILLTIDDRSFGKMGWSNSSRETVFLKDSSGGTVDLFTYSPQSRSGFSWERVDSTGAGRPLWDLAFIAGGTPGATNSRELIEVPQQMELEVDPNPFRPELAIRLSLPARSGQANLWLFDIEGARVREILSGADVSTRGEFLWDGRDKNGREVPPGRYIVYVEANVNGVVQQKKSSSFAPSNKIQPNLEAIPGAKWPVEWSPLSRFLPPQHPCTVSPRWSPTDG